MAEHEQRSDPEPEVIARLLTGTRTWAVVGWSPQPGRASNRIARFLHRHGFRVLPVNPEAVGADAGLDAPVVGSLREIDEPIDVVDVFRRSSAAGAVADEAVAVGAGAVWMQLGVVDEAAAARARAAGLDVVMDRCPAIELPRLSA
jgi:predicted CoA-binding protein